MAHTDQALALLAIARGRAAEGEAQLQDVSRRLGAMSLAAMGSAHSRSMSALYRRSGQPALAAALLRQALALTDPSQQPTEYAEVQAALTDLAAVGEPTG